MSLIGEFRRNSRPLTRAVAVLFAASWLGIALHPCDAAAQHVPEAPVHHDSSGAPHDCPHCPPPAAQSHDCDQAVALECLGAGEAALVAKAWKAPDPDAGGPLPGVLPALPPADAALTAAAVPPDPGGTPHSCSIQQRYCTYLK